MPKGAANLALVRLFKTVFKLGLVALLGAAIATAAKLLPKAATDTEEEEWFDVPSESAANE